MTQLLQNMEQKNFEGNISPKDQDGLWGPTKPPIQWVVILFPGVQAVRA
jgi:hypothetical protein